MTRVYKYEMPIVDDVEMHLPEGAEILTIGPQNGSLYIWARVDPDAPTEKRIFRIAGTGHRIVQKELSYLGTAFMYDATLVLHVFEVTTS